MTSQADQPQPAGHCVLAAHRPLQQATAMVGPHPACAACARKFAILDVMAATKRHNQAAPGSPARAQALADRTAAVAHLNSL